MRKLIFSTCLVALASLCACGGTGVGNPESSVEDSSVSGVAAGAAGGALSGSSSSGTLALLNKPLRRPRIFYPALEWMPRAWASTICPTYKSSSGCAASSGTMWLDYDDCSFSGGSAQWNGIQELVMSTGSASCGTFPYPGTSSSLTRQYTQSSGSTTPGSVTITSAFGTENVVDDASANLDNFDGDSISAILNSGYGTKVNYGALGTRTSVQIAHRSYITGTYDYSLFGTLSISESVSATSRTLSGSLTMYHNRLQVVGTSTFSNVIHKDSCCYPVSGTITTTFQRGSSVSPTTAGADLVGKSETLTLSGCGTGTIVSTDGTSSTVELTHCF